MAFQHKDCLEVDTLCSLVFICIDHRHEPGCAENALSHRCISWLLSCVHLGDSFILSLEPHPVEKGQTPGFKRLALGLTPTFPEGTVLTCASDVNLICPFYLQEAGWQDFFNCIPGIGIKFEYGS